jgi:DNA-binding HxlR family transcriptional regulator
MDRCKERPISYRRLSDVKTEVRTFKWRTHEKVSMAIKEKTSTDEKDPELCRYKTLCASRLEDMLRCIDGRWKMPILAHLSGEETMRFSDLERAIPQASQKMLTQHLRELERDKIVTRTVYPQVPPRVEYRLTDQGKALRPVFLSLLDWADARDSDTNASSTSYTVAGSLTNQ